MSDSPRRDDCTFCKRDRLNGFRACGNCGKVFDGESNVLPMTPQEAIERIQDMQRSLLFDDDIRDDAAIEMALSALQATIPRVLTAAEVLALPGGTPVWQECRWGEDHEYVPVKLLESFRVDDGRMALYGTCWRWWIGKKPTDAQREAENWAEGNGR